MPEPYTLTGEQMKSLKEAIIQAFPDRGRLAQLVRFHLDENLNVISDQTNLDQAVFELLGWAESKGRLGKVLRGVLDENPDNVRLQQAVQALGAYALEQKAAAVSVASRRTILVGGTGRSIWLSGPERLLASATGMALAAHGYNLLTGAWSGVDQIVAASFDGLLGAQPQPRGGQLWRFSTRDRTPGQPRGQEIRLLNDDEEVQRGLQLADAVVLIGGLNGTLRVAEAWLDSARPVFAFAGTGGKAADIYHRVLKRWPGAALPGLSAEQYEALGHTIETDSDAQKAASNLMGLLAKVFAS